MKPIPQVWEDLPLREYAEEFGDERLSVWLNPTLELTNERGEILIASVKLKRDDEEFSAKSEALNQRTFVWLSKVLTGVTLDEIVAAHKQSPDFVAWLSYRSTKMMDEFRQNKKKA